MGIYDVIIIGGGPAGLSAATWLGRCRRNVLLCTADLPRNYASRAMHGFLTRDGIQPRELLRIGREQLQPYSTVELREIEVTAIEICFPESACESIDKSIRFEVTLAGGSR